MEETGIGDVVASAAIAAAAGGLLIGSGLVVYSLATGLPAQSPLQALGAVVFAGFIGLLFALFTAWPAGVLIGALVWRFLGKAIRHAALAGGATTCVLFGLVVVGEPIRDFGPIAAGAAFTGLGALLGGLSYRYVVNLGTQ
jgi:hypothetical protein